MFEKVSPSHPDKVSDRIAGAIVDLCYTKSHDPKVACPARGQVIDIRNDYYIFT